MENHIVLLRSKRSRDEVPAAPSIESSDIWDRISSFPIHVLDVAVTSGLFDAVVVCRVENGFTIDEFLVDLDRDWDSEFLLVESHLRTIEGLPIAPSIVKSPAHQAC